MTEASNIAFEIMGRPIGRGAAPLIIAEMSGNHRQSLDYALEIVDAAAQAGAQALKLQTYTADTMTLDIRRGEFMVGSSLELWSGRSLYDLYQEAQTPWEWHAPIFERCRKHGMIAFSTPFDETAISFLEDLEVPMYKIASFELTDLPLIRRVAQTGKPMIMSTGMATIAEIDEAVTACRSGGCADIVLLKCTSSYPADPQNTNIGTIPHMRELFKCEIGLSDHTMGIGVAVGAVALGATVIEKHFTLRRADGGVDSAFSMEPQEFAALVTETHRVWQSVGQVTYGPTEAEKGSLQYRRSLYISRDVEAGGVLSPENLRIVRPALGLAPKYFSVMLGKRLKVAAAAGTPLSWDLIA
jgi:pseudaminic acid synthase